MENMLKVFCCNGVVWCGAVNIKVLLSQVSDASHTALWQKEYKVGLIVQFIVVSWFNHYYFVFFF